MTKHDFTTDSVEELVDYLFDDAASLSWRMDAEDELKRRGIETRQKHSGRLTGYWMLRQELGLASDEDYGA